jgi:hypothetical protein
MNPCLLELLAGRHCGGFIAESELMFWNKKRSSAVESDRPDRMKVVGYRQVAEFVYEVTTESVKYGRVTRKVLVLPESLINDRSDAASL